MIEPKRTNPEKVLIALLVVGGIMWTYLVYLYFT